MRFEVPFSRAKGKVEYEDVKPPMNPGPLIPSGLSVDQHKQIREQLTRLYFEGQAAARNSIIYQTKLPLGAEETMDTNYIDRAVVEIMKLIQGSEQ